MSHFVFMNRGVIDVESIKTFGVSSKEAPGAIGFFGTGLKYAIAILLRLGCSITIYAGEQELVFKTERARVRVDDFDFVTMNGERLGYTTELGKTWEAWQAFRELYCNCKDEGGSVFETPHFNPEKLEPNHTTVVVRGEKFHDAWAERSKTILETEPLWKHEVVHIHGTPSKYLYYRGVRAYELAEPSVYTYNIQRKLDLSEDRTIKYLYYAQAAIREGLLALENKNLLRSVLFAQRGTMEHDFDYRGVLPSEGFKEAVMGWRRERAPGLSPSAFEAVRPWIMSQLHENAPADLTPVEQKTLDDAKAFCELIGYPVASFPITVTEFLGEGVLGLAEDNHIYLSKRAFMMGAKMVAGTLLEEYFHLVTKYRDCTRDLQNYLIDALVSLGERHLGERL